MTIEEPEPGAVCLVCGEPSSSVLTANLVTVPGFTAGYASCPAHIDTVIARLQDELHEQMTIQHGALVDWWASVHPEPEPEPEEEP